MARAKNRILVDVKVERAARAFVDAAREYAQAEKKRDRARATLVRAIRGALGDQADERTVVVPVNDGRYHPRVSWARTFDANKASTILTPSEVSRISALSMSPKLARKNLEPSRFESCLAEPRPVVNLSKVK